GYRAAALPVLAAADFGLPAATSVLAPDRHPDGTLVRAGGRVFLLRAGVRRPVHPSLVATYGARPVLPAVPGDPARVGPPIGPADGALVRTPVGAAYVVESGVRRWVTGRAAARLRLAPSRAVLVDQAALVAATRRGPDVL
ncbi:MAG: hypothetical protein M3P93_14475, partial [Actinomycetota bacterium]|nr:hypothetical protein [Actinomycetota bacterium]